jgi:hypothetical protein
MVSTPGYAETPLSRLRGRSFAGMLPVSSIMEKVDRLVLGQEAAHVF